jgi:NhaA family Na+:H+ antiporter
VLIFAAFNWHDPGAIGGWAIPAATDIAFALGVLAVLGSRVPLSLKVFLTTIAIFDDIAAIVVIAIFYTADLSLRALLFGLAGTAVLIFFNRAGVVRIAPYIIVGVFIWVCVLKSGVHATLAGFAVALATPMRTADGDWSPVKHLEHTLHPWVAYLILPVFAFANAGVSFAGITTDVVFGTVSIGIAAGLFFGKQAGVFAVIVIMVKLGFARLPGGASWLSIYGVAVLTGIGFTMSFFIGSLAYPADNLELSAATRVGVLAGSLLSAGLGYAILRCCSAPDEESNPIPS